MEDLLFKAKIIGARTYNVFSPLIGAAIIYLIMTTPVMQWSRSLEKKVE
jgi:ABC-type amino acid transport system permease subunit